MAVVYTVDGVELREVRWCSERDQQQAAADQCLTSTACMQSVTPTASMCPVHCSLVYRRPVARASPLLFTVAGWLWSRLAMACPLMWVDTGVPGCS